MKEETGIRGHEKRRVSGTKESLKDPKVIFLFLLPPKDGGVCP